MTLLHGFVGSSCSDDARAAGPLQAQFGVATMTCSPSQEGWTATLGDIYVEPPDGLEVTFQGVSLKESEDLTVVGAVIAPARLPLVLSDRGFPPQSVSEEIWDQTRPLEGAVLGRETELILVGVRLDAARGEGETVLLDYEVDGTNYTAVIERSYRLRARC